MRFLLEPDDAAEITGLFDAARAARAAGLDGVFIAARPELPAPLVCAAAVAAAVDNVLIAAEVQLGDRHPVELAEEAAVVDLASAGRLVLVTRPASDLPGRFAEGLDLLRAAFTPRPFRHAGSHWAVPARLPQNKHAPARARVTPAPFQPRLELWSAGPPDGVGPARALGHLANEDDDPADLARMWDIARATLGAAALGAPRARRETWNGSERLVERLRAGRATFDQDWAVVRASPGAARTIGAQVRPRVQLDELPPGLHDHWARSE